MNLRTHPKSVALACDWFQPSPRPNPCWRVLLVGLAILTAVACPRAQAGLNSGAEYAGLQALYGSTGGASWTTSTNWETGDACAWHGITCDQDTTPSDNTSHVININLESNNLTGNLPALTGLTNLQYIDVSANHLSGPIPSLGGLANLLFFLAGNNRLSGALPAAGPALVATGSALCPNNFAGSDDVDNGAWDAATGTTPWYLPCDTIFATGFECCSSGGPYSGGEPAGQGGAVTATIVDQTGAALSNQPTYICGLNLCTSDNPTNSSGSVSYSTAFNMTKPAFKFGDTISYAEFAIPVTPNSTTNFGTIQTGKFPALGSGSTLTPGTAAVSGDVTVSLAVGSTISIDVLDYSTSDEQKLRTVAIPVTAQSSMLLPCSNCGFQLLYGITPAETTICPAATVTVALPHQTQTPNDFGWAPGATVEFWVTTIDTSQQYAPYAGWREISGGTVSADGTSISTNAGEGFNFLESFAARLKP